MRDEHEPGDYLFVAIQAYDSQGNMVMIENPKPTKVFRIVDLRNKKTKRWSSWDGERTSRQPTVS